MPEQEPVVPPTPVRAVKIHVGTLSYRHVAPSAHGSAMRMAFSIAPMVSAFSFKEDTYLPQARCDIADSAIEQYRLGNATHLLWLDDDLLFYETGFDTPTTDGKSIRLNLAARLASHGKPVVSAVYYLHGDARPVAMMLNPNGELNATFIERVPKQNVLMDVDVVGFGCVLMDIKVLVDMRERFKDDLFQMPPVQYTDPVTKKVKARSVGEDLFFCHRLKQMGVPVALDCGIHLGHVKSEAMDRDGHVLMWGEDSDGPVEMGKTPIERAVEQANRMREEKQKSAA